MSMTNTHTTACGTEPFDKNYCIGYQVHHEDWSPFPRVNHLRQTFLDGKYWIDIERLRLVTETYQKYENKLPRKVCAQRHLRTFFFNCTLYIYDEDLIALLSIDRMYSS